MALYSTPEWRSQLHQFLNHRDWSYVRWAQEINARPLYNDRYLHLSEYGLSRWVNHSQNSSEYRVPKAARIMWRLAHAMIQLGVVSEAEAKTWLLAQGLYPLPQEASIFGQEKDNCFEAC